MNRQHSIRTRIDWAVTKLFRFIGPRQVGDEKIDSLIRKKIKTLGRQYEDGNSNCIGYTYHPIYFRDLGNVSCHRGESACRERLECIEKEVEVNPGDRVLDVGANVGFFSFALASQGAIVDAIEAQTESFEVGAALSKKYDATVYFVNKPVSVEVLNHLDHHYKISLLLSVLHWVMKQEGKQKTIEILRAVADRSEMIFVEVPSDPSDGMVFHEEFSSLDNVRKFLTEALPDHDIEEILQNREWGNRSLFKISVRT
jgi:hypothetical protein